MVLNADGRVLSSGPLPIQADTDEQAGVIARGMVDGHDVELWDGLRLIEHYSAHGKD